MKTDDILVTFSDNIYDVKSCKLLPFNEVMQIINSNKYKGIINIHREKVKRDSLYDNKYKKQLPKIIFEGEFNERTYEGLIKLNGLILLDFDKVNDVDLLKDKIISYTNPLAIFISVSGSLKVLYKIDSKEPELFTYCFQVFKDSIDTLLKNTNNLYYILDSIPYCTGTYIPYDCIYYNDLSSIHQIEQKALKLKAKLEKTSKTRTNIISTNINNGNLRSNNKIVVDIINKLNESNLVFCDDYEEWFKVGSALFDIFDNDTATEYYEQLSRMSDKFNEKEFVKKCEQIIKNKESNDYVPKFSIGTILYYYNKTIKS